MFTAILLILTMGGCSEKDPNLVGFGLVAEDDHWQTDQAVIQEVLADSCITVSTGTGEGFHLLVGSWEGQEARSLLLFEELPDTLSWPLRRARLILVAKTEAEEDPLTISAHSVQREWQEDEATWDNPWSEAGGDLDPEPIAEGVTADTLKLDFTEAGRELVEGWMAGQVNNGVIIKALELPENNVKFFYTSETPFDPMLQLTFATGDTTDTTVAVKPAQDAYIVQPGEPVAENFLCVGDGHIRRSWIQFDLSSVPESVFVNLATLSLSVSEFTDPLDEMTIAACLVTDVETLDFSSSSCDYADLFTGDDLLQFDITTLVQKWSNGTTNAGLMLKGRWEYNSLSQALFFDRTADSSLRPKITVLYTAPPTGNLTKHIRGDQNP